MRNNIGFVSLATIVISLSLLGGCGDKTNATEASSPQPVTAQQPEGTIAHVGDQVITFGQLNTMLNSSAVVGVSIPALGTPELERNQSIAVTRSLRSPS